MKSQGELNETYLTQFLESQCSWCKKFYTNHPFKCPYDELRSSCNSFDRVIEIIGWWTREKGIKEYEQRILGMMVEVEQRGIMTKCRASECGALNPNPQKNTCWKYEDDTFQCPVHSSLILRYNIMESYWKCPDASHGLKFYKNP